MNSFFGSWNKEWKEPKIGDAHGTPKIIQGHQKVKAWGCPGRHPLFRPLPSVIYLELYFYSPTWYVFCLECLALFVSLCLSMTQSSLLHTPFERAIHELKFDRILYELHLYLLSYVVLLYVLHLYLLSIIILLYVLHLDLLEHGGGFVLKKLLIYHASLKLFWESLNSMVICLIIICLVFKICETFFWVCWILRKDWSMIIVLRYGGYNIKVMLVE